MQSQKYFSLAVVFAAAFTLMAGCDRGPKMGTVNGTVTLDDRPVANLEVTFNPKDPSLGTSAIGYTQADGTYSLYYPGSKLGAPVGEYTVSIVGSEGGEEEDAGPPVSVPARYNAKTTLSFTVKPGENTADFSLASGA